MRVPLVLLGASTFLAAAGCAVPSPEGGPDAEATSSTATAVVVVERTSGPGEASRGDAVVARVIRVRQGAVDDPALRMAGVTNDIPAAGTCATSFDDHPTLTTRNVELLDVGAVSLESAQGRTTLQPRSAADPSGVVSGVFYAARSAEAFAPASRVTIRGSGGQDLDGGFLVNVGAPRDVADVRVVTAPAGLDVAWDATDADPRDLVYVDVLGPGARVVARCSTLDYGHAVVPHTLAGALEEGQIAVHRVHRELFRARGIDPGEVRFDVARIVAFHR